MRTMTVKELLTAVHGQLIAGDENMTFQTVCSDSRECGPNVLFLPIVGEHADGHMFIDVALERGSTGTLCHREPAHIIPGKFYVQVPNTRLALKALASYVRNEFTIPVIQITGSVGKTTTKDMVAAVLGTHYKVLKTAGNLNNDLGAPRTLLELEPYHEVAVVETGMDHFGEIRYLGEMVRPTIAVITNIGVAHMENLGSQEGICLAKCEIFDHLKRDGVAILNGDDEFLNKVKKSVETIRYGEHANNQVRALDVTDTGLNGIICEVQTEKDTYHLHIPAPGRHMIYPAMVAVIIGERLGLTKEEIEEGVEAYEPSGSRMHVMRLSRDRIILDDCYNASPASMEAALEVLAESEAEKRIAVLGDMFELGEATVDGHRAMGCICANLPIDILFAIGEYSKEMADAARQMGMEDVRYYTGKEEALPEILKEFTDHTTMLVKASHGMGFDEITEKVK